MSIKPGGEVGVTGGERGSGGAVTSGTGTRGWLEVAQRWLLRWEALLVLLIIIAGAWNSVSSPYFLNWPNLFDMTSQFMDKAMMALPMTFIIITGGIDLSVSSILALAGVCFGQAYATSGNLPASMALALVIGTACGLANGLLTTRFKLHPLVVTLGSMALFRGLAQVVLGDKAISSFPDSFNAFAQGYVGKSFLLPFGDMVPWPLLVFIGAAVIAGLILHRTGFGRLVFAIGNNEDACRYSGIAVDRIKIIVYTASGLVAAFAGLAYASLQGAARWDMGSGFELDAITAVVLGGTDINGGSGSIPGTVLALFLIGILRNGMGLANIGDQNQMIVVGGLLILSILGPTVAQRLGLRPASVKGG